MAHTAREKVLWSIAILVVLLYALIPVVWIASSRSRSRPTSRTGSSSRRAGSPSTTTTRSSARTSSTPRWSTRSGIAAIATLISIVLAAMAAYATARLDFTGKTLILSGALAVAMFPPISIVGSLFDMWRSVGLFDTWLGLIIPYMTFTLPLAIYTMSAFFREIPWELEQAAQVDGATPFQAFTKVIVPLAAPGVFTTAILVFIFAWNDFLFANTLTSTDAARTVPAALAFFTGASQFEDPTGAIAAAAVVVTIPIIILVLIFQRRIVAGPHRRRRQGIRRPPMADITLENITKRYPDGYEAVKDMNLTIEDGEFVILVGPSGCGKSTALRMIAGLEDITDGELKIGGQVVNQKAPKDRDIAMVFQNYALYPHMTVRENMGFALKLRGVDKAEIDKKVEEAAGILDLTAHLDRKPANLSGGQRQRVAMGRAIVRDPAAFLMDEPLSNLDAKLRVQMRTEVSRIQDRLGTTTVYVTHDQTEAMTLGDRVAVMRAGVLQQVGSPMELYNDPKNLFVAGFIGSPGDELHAGDGRGRPGEAADGRPAGFRRACPETGQATLIAGIRPEDFEDAALVGEARHHGTTFKAKIEVLESMGSELYAHFSVASDQQIESQELAELAQDSGAGRGALER